MATKKNYYDNGILISSGVEINNKKEGKWLFYYKNGKIYKEIEFSDGIENGEWKMFYENGKPQLVQQKNNGVTCGVVTEYYENGQVMEVGNYKDEKYYPEHFWNESGQQLLKDGTGRKIEKFGYLELDIIEQYYRNGKFISEKRISTADYGDFKPYTND